MTDIASHVAGGVRQRRRKRDRVKGLFDDLSVAQVLAGALAAVTSMLLASQIGIYGSVIGVGVGSVISAVASQLYKKFLSASADKIREVGGHGDGNAEPEGRDARFVEDDSAATIALPAIGSGPSASETIAFRAVDADTSSAAFSADTTALPTIGQNQAAMHTVVLPATAAASLSIKAKSAGGSNAPAPDTAMYKDAKRVRARAARQRKERVKQRVLVVSVVSALVAVVLSAAVVMFVTQGEGMGEKPQHFISAGQNAVSIEDSHAAQNDGGAGSASWEGDTGDQDSSASGDQNPSSESSSSGEESSSANSGSGSHGSANGSTSDGSQQDSSGESNDSGGSGDSHGSSGSSASDGAGGGNVSDGSGSASGAGESDANSGGNSGSSSGSAGTSDGSDASGVSDEANVPK